MSGIAQNWLKSFQSIADDSRWFILNLMGIVRLRCKPYDENASHQYLVVTLIGFNHGRYGFQLLNYFSLAGYQIVFYNSLTFLFRLRRYDRGIFNLPGAMLWKRSMATSSRSFPWMRLNSQPQGSTPFPVSLQLLVDLDFFGQRNHPGKWFHLPYFVHPLLGQNYFQLARYRTQKNRRRILMYGEPNLPVDRRMLHDYFELIDRSTVFDILQHSDIHTFTPESFEDLLLWLHQEEKTHILCLIDSRKVWIPINRWIEVLSSFDFFVATPGYCMPHAHNLMEAMAVGTIPVLQYHGQLQPPLIPNEHCIEFADPEGLIAAIHHVLELSDEQVTSMQESVLQYYMNHVDPAAVVPQIFEVADIEKKLRLYFNAEEMSLQYLETDSVPH